MWFVRGGSPRGDLCEDWRLSLPGAQSLIKIVSLASWEAIQRERRTEYKSLGSYAESTLDYAPHTCDIAMEFFNWESVEATTADAAPEWNRAANEGNLRGVHEPRK